MNDTLTWAICFLLGAGAVLFIVAAWNKDKEN